MPIHVDELTSDEPFPVKPDTNEYEALSFLVAHREYGFTPAEIADHTDISESSASKTMARLFEKGLVERSAGAYYVDPERADTLKQRLTSLDSAVKLFNSAPSDDAYAEAGWEDEMPSIDPDNGSITSTEGGTATAEDQAEDLIAELEEERDQA
jgi:DNA-binding MarR family transcriptional regulator